MLYSTACEYAILALTHLAGRPPGRMTLLAEISGAENLPGPFLGKLLRDLGRAGLVKSARGPRGGYALAYPAHRISLLEIKRAIEGTADLDRCAAGLDVCSDDTPCPLHDTFEPLRRAIRTYLEDTTLEDLSRALARKRVLLAERAVGAGR